MDVELNASLAMAFKEDKVILERIQLEEERDPDVKRMILGIDAAPMKMRRMVDKLIEAEGSTHH
jgi:vanillate O-demethylase monooxygenase subunit